MKENRQGIVVRLLLMRKTIQERGGIEIWSFIYLCTVPAQVLPRAGVLCKT